MPELLLYPIYNNPILDWRESENMGGYVYASGWSDYQGMGLWAIAALHCDPSGLETYRLYSPGEILALQSLIDSPGQHCIGWNNWAFDNPLMIFHGISLPPNTCDLQEAIRQAFSDYPGPIQPGIYSMAALAPTIGRLKPYSRQAIAKMIQDDAPINLIEDAISNNVDCIWTMWRYRYEVNVPGRGVANIMELDYDYMDLAVNYIKQEAIGVIGRMGFASLPPCGFVPERLVPYSSQLSKRLDRDGVAVHFWKPRNQHLWTFPNRGLAALRRYPCVLSPTIYTDSSQPFWRRVMLHGLKQELAAYWSSQGLSVLPVVGWCDRSDFEFCLDGIPKESVIAIPGIERRSVELPGDALYRQSLFLDGLELLEQSIYPSSLVLAGGSQAQFSRVSEAVSCLVVHLCL